MEKKRRLWKWFCYRDIPQGEPALVSEMLNPFPDRTFLFRMVEFLTRGGIPDQGAVMQTFAANHKLTNSRKDIEKGIDGRVITEPVGKAGARST